MSRTTPTVDHTETLAMLLACLARFDADERLSAWWEWVGVEDADPRDPTVWSEGPFGHVHAVLRRVLDVLGYDRDPGEREWFLQTVQEVCGYSHDAATYIDTICDYTAPACRFLWEVVQRRLDVETPMGCCRLYRSGAHYVLSGQRGEQTWLVDATPPWRLAAYWSRFLVGHGVPEGLTRL